MPLLDVFDLFRRDGSRRRHPRLPPSIPMAPIRQAWLFATDQAGYLEALHRNSPAAFTLDVPGRPPQVGFTDEASIKRLLAATSESFANSNEIVVFFLGDRSTLLLEGDAHARSRARTLSAFGGDRMRGYGQVVLDVGDGYIDRLAPSQRVSAIEAGRRMALEIILQALFGMQPGPEHDRMMDLVSRFLDGGHNPISTLLSLYVPGRLLRELVYGRRDPKTMRQLEDQGVFGLAASMPGIAEGRALLDAVVELIERRRVQIDQPDDRTDDALGFILRRARDLGEPYDAAEALDETLTLLLAGHDTTAITLSMALYRLAQAPEVVATMRAELDEAFGDAPLELRRVERLPYLAAVLDECLRLDALGRGFARRLLRPMRFGDYDLPAGSIAFAYTYPFGRDGSHFRSPDAFDPDQMLGHRLKPHEFAPFGGGYRRCTGAAFATYELKILLAEFVRRVDFAFPPGERVEVGMLGPVIAPRGAVPIDILAVRPAPQAPFAPV